MMIHEIAPHRYQVEYKDQSLTEQDTLLICKKGELLCKKGEETLEYPTAKEMKVTRGRYLFTVDSTAFFQPLDWDGILPQGWEYRSIQLLRHARPRHLAFAGLVGSRISGFYHQNRFCGCCGGTMSHSPRERAMVCPECGYTAYPQIAPSVIVAVVDGEKILLTKYQPTHSSYQNYALIAGYNELGESLEETVRREVMEEVGLQVEDVTYYKSQPWPFTGALLAGFFCRVKGDSRITLEEGELSEARWVSREELAPRPNSPSLTGEMMEQFRLGLEPV